MVIIVADVQVACGINRINGMILELNSISVPLASMHNPAGADSWALVARILSVNPAVPVPATVEIIPVDTVTFRMRLLL